MESTECIIIDFDNECFEQSIMVTQYDTGKKVRCHIKGTSGNVGLAMVYCRKPSGLETYTNADVVDDHTVEFYITQQMNAEIGETKCQLQLFGDDKSLTSYKFKMRVRENMIADSRITSTDEYTAFLDAVSKLTGTDADLSHEIEVERAERKSADEIEKAARMSDDAVERNARQTADAEERAERIQEIAIERARIDNLITANNPTEGNSELSDIRVGFDGTTYDSAGEAVREQFEKIWRCADPIDIFEGVITYKGKYIHAENGAEYNMPDVLQSSGFVKIPEYVKTILLYNNLLYENDGFAFYDSEQIFISGINKADFESRNYKKFDVPDNAVYIRGSSKIDANIVGYIVLKDSLDDIDFALTMRGNEGAGYYHMKKALYDIPSQKKHFNIDGATGIFDDKNEKIIISIPAGAKTSESGNGGYSKVFYDINDVPEYVHFRIDSDADSFFVAYNFQIGFYKYPSYDRIFYKLFQFDGTASMRNEKHFDYVEWDNIREAIVESGADKVVFLMWHMSTFETTFTYGGKITLSEIVWSYDEQLQTVVESDIKDGAISLKKLDINIAIPYYNTSGGKRNVLWETSELPCNYFGDNRSLIRGYNSESDEFTLKIAPNYSVRDKGAATYVFDNSRIDYSKTLCVEYDVIAADAPLHAYFGAIKSSDGTLTYISLGTDEETGHHFYEVDLPNLKVYSDVERIKNFILNIGADEPNEASYTITNLVVYQDLFKDTKYFSEKLPDYLSSLDKAVQNVEEGKEVNGKSCEMKEVIAVSPNGSRFVLSVDNSGAVKANNVVPDNVLFIGNSLLQGFVTFGMAAQDDKHDYYYYVTEYIKKNISEPIFERLSGSSWESMTDPESANSWVDSNVGNKISENTKLVLIQLSDNVNTSEKRECFKTSCGYLTEYIREHAVNARVAWVAAWYPTPENIDVIEEVCEKTGSIYIDIRDLATSENRNRVGNTYIDSEGEVQTITSEGVASHPSSRGMLAIANRILYKLGITVNEKSLRDDTIGV